jgi:aspartate dehydrogenase
MAQGDVDGETTLYDGPTRGICAEYPRNVNSHATVAVSGLGFDRTQSTLVADPSTDEAIHHIVAEGDGTTLEVSRTSSIEGVTGAYTLDSIWGTVGRIVDDGPGLTVV